MKIRSAIAVILVIAGMSGCAADGSYDVQVHQDVNAVLDTTGQVLELVRMGMDLFGR